MPPLEQIILYGAMNGGGSLLFGEIEHKENTY